MFAEVLEHLYTAPELVLPYLRELLVPGGVLLLQTPNAVAFRKRAKMVLGVNPFERIRTERDNPGHFREYTASELRELLVGAGFSVDRVWMKHYFDVRYARHERGDEPPRLISGMLKNVFYRLLPASLRKGSRFLPGESEPDSGSARLSYYPAIRAVTPRPLAAAPMHSCSGSKRSCDHSDLARRTLPLMLGHRPRCRSK